MLEKGWWCALLLASNSSISIVQINGDNYIFAVILSVVGSKFLPLFVFLMRDIFFTSLIVLYRWMDLIFFFFFILSPRGKYGRYVNVMNIIG